MKPDSRVGVRVLAHGLVLRGRAATMMRPMDDDRALYLPDADGFVATLCTQGGWNPEHQHGGPVQALLTRAVEHTPTLGPMQVARLTHDLFRPVPIGQRLIVSTQIVREGKRIQVVDAVLRVGEVEHARTRALRLRESDLTDARGFHGILGTAVKTPRPEDLTSTDWASERVLPGFLEGIELRRFQKPDAPEGAFGYWVRLRGPLIAGETPTPLQQMSVAGDFANMIGATFDAQRVTAINPDLNLHILRLPKGEWIAVSGDTRLGLASGVGVSTAELRDREGVCALAANSSLIQRR